MPSRARTPLPPPQPRPPPPLAASLQAAASGAVQLSLRPDSSHPKRLSRRQLAILHAFLALTVDPEAQGVCCESEMLAYLHGDTERGFDAPTKREAKAISLSELQTEVEDMVTSDEWPLKRTAEGWLKM